MGVVTQNSVLSVIVPIQRTNQRGVDTTDTRTPPSADFNKFNLSLPHFSSNPIVIRDGIRQSPQNPSSFQGATAVQANRNRSSRLIDIGGTPFGDLTILPIAPTAPPIPPPSSYTISEEGIVIPTIHKISKITIPDEASRLRSLHVDDGFLDAYYGQVHNMGTFGMRSESTGAKRALGFSAVIKPKLKTVNSIGRNINKTLRRYFGVKTNFNTDTRLSFDVAPDRKQPFIIRGIGQRWGIDKVQKPNAALSGISGLVQVDRASYKGKDLVKSYINLLDDVGGRILGRSPSVFLDRYYADVKRIDGITNALTFFTRGSTFINAQAQLQKRNPFEMVTTSLYALSEDHTLKVAVDTFLPDKYKGFPIKGQLEEFSKGATWNLNPQAYNPLSLFSVPGVLGINRNSYTDISTIVSKGTLIDHITDEVLNLTADAITTHVKTKVVPRLRKRFPWIKETEDSIKATAKDAVDAVKKIKKINEKAKKVAEFFHVLPSTRGNASKAASAKIVKSLGGFSTNKDTRGVDKVNLIPYNQDVYTKKPLTEQKRNLGPQGETLDQLDWIPFKFRDARKAKGDNGFGSIVFRAILSGITDTFTPEYASERYVGRPDKVHVYQGTDREISFTFDVYPKSAEELPVLWEKLNYLAGLTYPHWADGNADGGGGMIAPHTELTIGQMYTDTPGYISALTYTVQDNGTWETTFAKLPKYVQVSCTFIYIGDRLPSATQKHYELPWVSDEVYDRELSSTFRGMLKTALDLKRTKPNSLRINLSKLSTKDIKGFMGKS